MITNKLQHFVGKVCTVFTQPINRNYKEENPASYPKQMFEYFMGWVESIDANGILIRQLQTGMKCYFFMPSIIGIAEEKILDPLNKADAEEIEEMTRIKEEMQKKMPPKQQPRFLDPTALAALAKNAASVNAKP